MTLLVTVFAAVLSTALWYRGLPKNEMRLGVLCWMFWGASLMWLVDAVFAYAEQGAAYFTPAPEEMCNDLFLGLCVVALALVVWVVVLLFKDPKGTLKNLLFHKKTTEKSAFFRKAHQQYGFARPAEPYSFAEGGGT